MKIGKSKTDNTSTLWSAGNLKYGQALFMQRLTLQHPSRRGVSIGTIVHRQFFFFFAFRSTRANVENSNSFFSKTVNKQIITAYNFWPAEARRSLRVYGGKRPRWCASLSSYWQKTDSSFALAGRIIDSLPRCLFWTSSKWTARWGYRCRLAGRGERMGVDENVFFTKLSKWSRNQGRKRRTRNTHTQQ